MRKRKMYIKDRPVQVSKVKEMRFQVLDFLEPEHFDKTANHPFQYKIQAKIIHVVIDELNITRKIKELLTDD